MYIHIYLYVHTYLNKFRPGCCRKKEGGKNDKKINPPILEPIYFLRTQNMGTCMNRL